MTRRRGFTLFEITVVIVIIAMLAAVSMPRMKGALLNARLKRATRDVAGLLLFARNTAVLREAPCEVRFDLKNDAYQLVLLDEAGVEIETKDRRDRERRKDLLVGDDAMGERKLPKDVHFVIIYSGAPPTGDKGLPRVIYYADGSATPATITIQDERTDDKGDYNRAFNVEVYQTTGVARVEQGMPTQQNDKSRLHYGPKYKGEKN